MDDLSRRSKTPRVGGEVAAVRAYPLGPATHLPPTRNWACNYTRLALSLTLPCSVEILLNLPPIRKG